MDDSILNTFELLIPAYDCDARTSSLVLDVHPGQIRILDYLTKSPAFPFRNRDDTARLSLCIGAHTLLEDAPHPFLLLESRMDLLQDEHFERQKTYLADNVAKLVACGQVDTARRIINVSFAEYSRIRVGYWRERWLSTIEAAAEVLRRGGIAFTPNIPRTASGQAL